METAEIVVQISKIVSEMIRKVEAVYLSKGHLLQISSDVKLLVNTVSPKNDHRHAHTDLHRV